MPFRRDFGLNADPGYVRNFMRNPNSYCEHYPVAVAPEDETELRSLVMEQRMTPLEEFAARQPEFAGHWIDQSNGGVIKVAFASGAAGAHRAPAFALPVVLVARGVEDGGTRSTRSLVVDVDVSDMHNNERRQWRWSTSSTACPDPAPPPMGSWSASTR